MQEADEEDFDGDEDDEEVRPILIYPNRMHVHVFICASLCDIEL